MRVRYGAFRFTIAATELTISSNEVPNALGVPVAIETVWAMKSRLRNPTGVSKKFKPILAAFEQAFLVNGKDLVLEHSDGTPSHHRLLSNNCIGGTRVTKLPSYPQSAGGEAVTYRTVQVEVTGIQPLNASQFMAFNEQISVRGGGARYGCREVNVGLGVRQQLRTNTTCFATQSGSATGYLQYPSPPPPIWPDALVDQLPDVTVSSPLTLGSGINAIQKDYTISWSYSFAFPQRLFGTPHYLTGS